MSHLSFGVCIISMLYFLLCLIYLQISCFFKAEQYSFVYMYQFLLSIHQQKDIQGFLHFLPIMSRVAMNIAEHISMKYNAKTSGHMPSTGRFIFSILRTVFSDFHSGCIYLQSYSELTVHAFIFSIRGLSRQSSFSSKIILHKQF